MGIVCQIIYGIPPLTYLPSFFHHRHIVEHGALFLSRWTDDVLAIMPYYTIHCYHGNGLT